MNSRNLTLAAVAVALAVAVFVDGGFDEGTRVAFAAVAGLALVVAIASGLDTGAAMRAPALLALVTLAALAIASAAWTIAEPAEAFRWGLVIAGYAALAITAAAVAGREGGVFALATLVAAVALAAALEGLVAFAIREKPLALHLAGEWQAAGPFEYPPALALAQASVLPILLRGMTLRRKPLAVIAAAMTAAAGMAVAVSGSRIVLALVLAIAAAAVLAPERTLRVPRSGAVAAVGTALGIPALAVLATDPADPASSLGSDAGRLAVIVGTIALAGFVWALAGKRWTAPADGAIRDRPPPPLRPVAGLAILGAVACAAFFVSSLTERSGEGVEGRGGPLHDRVDNWSAAVATVEERPVLGAGAEAYLVASLDEQDRDPVLYAHSLPLEATVELGILGGLLVIGVYAGAAVAIWEARRTDALWLFAPAVAAFLLVNLVDWPWHLAGAGALWALALGGLVGAAEPESPGGSAGSP